MSVLVPEPAMKLHTQRAIDTRLVAWPHDRLTSNDNEHWAQRAPKIKKWRTLAYNAFRGVPPIPPGAQARVVVYFRQPPGRGEVKDIPNLNPIVKACIDGITHGPTGKGKGPWPDDTTKHVMAQDVREITPPGPLKIVFQVWVTVEPPAAL